MEKLITRLIGVFDSLFTRGQRFLLKKASKLSADVKNKLQNGEIVFSESFYYVRSLVSGGSIIDLLNNDDAIKCGVTNISKQRLPQFVNLALSRIELRACCYSVSSPESAHAPAPESLIYAPISNTLTDAAFVNGELELLVNQKQILKAPINRFCDEIANVSGTKDGINLNAIKLITDSDEIQIRLHCAKGLALSSVNAVEVVLRGDETRQK